MGRWRTEPDRRGRGTIDTSALPANLTNSDAVRFNTEPAANITQVVNNAGTIIGLDSGVIDETPTSRGGTRTLLLTNTGTIRGLNKFGVFSTSGSSVAGDDVVINDGGVISGGIGSVRLWAGDDTLENINGGQLIGNVNLGTGNDLLTNDGSIDGDVNFDRGDDILTSSGSITGEVDLGVGNDTATFSNGSVTSGPVLGGKGEDSVTVEAGARLENAQESVILGDDADTLDVSGTITGEVVTGVRGNINRRQSDAQDVVIVRSGGEIIRGAAAGGRRAGIFVSGAIDLTVEAGGTIDNTAIAPGATADAVHIAYEGTTDVTHVINNAGTIKGSQNGIADARTTVGGITTLNVTNTGSISGETQFGIQTLSASGAGNDLIVNDGGTISGASGSLVLSDGNDTVRNVNGGQLDGDVDLGAGNDVLLNQADIVGDITLGDGDDLATFETTSTMTGNLDAGDGSDTVTIDGIQFNGDIDLGTGDDTFVIHDGTTVTGNVDGGTGTDTFNTDINTAASLGAVQGFETLTKTGTGTLNLTGPGASSFETVNVNEGTVDVGGSITDVNAATVLAGATLNANGPVSFTTGADTLSAAGTVTGASTIDLLDGDDMFTLREGANISAVVDGGAGTDTLTADILTSGNLAQAVNFETLTKTGAGVLNITGPGASGFSTVNVNAGTLDVAAGASLTHVNAATVASGATVALAGSMQFTAGADTFDVSGALTGAGGFGMLGGADTLTLRDGVDLTGLTGTIDGGADADAVVVDNAADLTLDGANIANFETLQKDNTGTLTLTGTQTYSSGTVVNMGTLDVDGTLNTAATTLADGTALNVGGTVDDGAGGQTAINGSTGVNTVNVTGTLLGSGDLGDGADVLDVAGTLDTGAGTLSLGTGDDTFVIHDGTTVTGNVDGGTGTDTFNTDINTTASLGAVQGFETLTKTGVGVLNLTGPGASSFETVNVNEGTVDVGGSITDINAATVLAGATLNANGPVSFTTGADTLSAAGTVTGASTIDLLDGDDMFTLQEGADISAVVDGGAGTDTLTADILTSGNLAQAVNFETLTKTGAGVLNITGPGASDFSTVNVDEGTLDIASAGGLTDVNMAAVAAGAALNVEGNLGFTDAADTLTLAGVLTGAANIDMLDGDDNLTVQDGADLNGYSGLLDGGAGTADKILLDGWSGAIDGANFQNWEVMTVQNGTVDFGTPLTLASGADQGLIVGAGGVANVTASLELTGDLTTLAGGTFQDTNAGATLIAVLGNIRNAGMVSFQDGAADDMLTVTGDYSGGGELHLDVDFTGNTADTLVISGDVAAPGTTIFVADISGGPASGEDILLVDVAGDTTDEDFQLDGGTVSVGTLNYILNRVGSQWLLQLAARPQNLFYEVYPRNLMALNEMLTHHQRTQNRTWLIGGDTETEDAGVWVTISGGIRDLDPKFSTTAVDFGTSDIDYDINTSKIEAGLDFLLGDYNRGRLVGGVRVFGGSATLDASSPLTSGTIDSDALGLGASLTWYDDSDLYVDAQVQVADFDSDLTTDTGALVTGNDGSGYAVSLEVGKTFDLRNAFSVTPQIQYVQSEVKFDSFTASNGDTVSLDDGSSSELRLGATFEYQTASAAGSFGEADNRLYLNANLFHQFDTTTLGTSGTSALINEVRPWRGELGIGGSREWTNRSGTRSMLYGDVTIGSELGSGFDTGRSLSGRIGFALEF